MPARAPRPSHRSRGSVYLAVLGAAMLVTVIGLSALLAVRVRRRSTQAVAAAVRARLHARSALEIALQKLAMDPNWRTTYTNDTWTNVSVPDISGLTLSYKFVDQTDANLADTPADPVRVYGKAQVRGGIGGGAVRIYSVLLKRKVRGLSCLNVALHAGGEIIFDIAEIYGGVTISTNGDIKDKGSSTIHADLEAVGTISMNKTTSTMDGTVAEGLPSREMPGSDVFEYYLAHGTRIPISDIPKPVGSGNHILDKNLSPTSNPYGAGATNPQGIYIIDCLNEDLLIENCTLNATLVLLKPGSKSQVGQGVTWRAAVPTYPALMVRGRIKFDMVSGDLITGLVYVSDRVRMDSVYNGARFDGVVVLGGRLELTNAALHLTYDPIYLNNPPPGFIAEKRMVPVMRTWRREVR